MHAVVSRNIMGASIRSARVGCCKLTGLVKTTPVAALHSIVVVHKISHDSRFRFESARDLFTHDS